MTLFDTETPAASVTPVAGVAGTNGGPAGAVSGEGHRSAGPLLTIHVVGVPQPQGSKRGFVVNGRAIVVDDNKKTLRTWRDDVKHAAMTAIDDCAGGYCVVGGAVELDITFLMPRPKGHFGTGRNAQQLRASAPSRPTTKPDVDKLLRATLDALKVAGIYVDDSLVVTLTGRKLYATDHPGALIQVYAGSGA